MTIFRNTKSMHEKLQVFFQIIFFIKYLRSLSLAELQAYNSFTKAKLFHRVFAEHLCQYQRLSIYQCNVLWLLLKTHAFKHMYQICKRNSFSSFFKKLQTGVNKRHYQTYPSKMLGKYRSDQKHYLGASDWYQLVTHDQYQ